MPTLEIAIDARKSKAGADEFNRSVRSITGGAAAVDKSIAKADKGLGVFGRRLLTFAAVYGVARFIKETVRLAGIQEDAIAQLNSRLKSTQGISGQTIKSLRGLSGEMQRLTKYSDEEVEAAEAIALTFTKIRGDVFPRTIKSIANVATVMQIDLRSATTQLAKALNDPIANLGLLSRAGIQFSKEQKALVKQLWETGRFMDAQNVILNELETQYGGAAQAVGTTLAGALARAQNAWDDFKETLGDVVFRDFFKWFAERSRETFEAWTKWVNENAVKIRGFMIDMVAWGKRLGAVLGLIVDGFHEIWQLVKPLIELQLKLQGKAFGFLGGLFDLEALKNISPHLDKFLEKLNEINVWSEQQKRILAEPPTSISVVGEMTPETVSLWSKFLAKFKQGVSEVQQMQLAAEGIGEAFGTAFERAIIGAENLSDVMQGLLKDIAAAVVRAAVIQPIVQGITSGLTPTVPSALGNAFQGGRALAFAGGGVVSGPTLFPMAGGRRGLMGEAGPEAIMPLQRDSSGRLGVSGGSNITMIINTPDADSFRRSQHQIIGDMKRAARRG